MKLLILSALAILLLPSCSYINQKMGLQDDNLGEEVIEAVIKTETGLDIDLTPASPE